MSKKTQRFDVVIIGSGPGGEGAAMQARKQGLRVLVVEKFPFVGGGCTHTGTIPSKALRYSANKVLSLYTDPLLGLEPPTFTFSKLMEQAKKIIWQQVKLRNSHYDRNDIEVLHGHAQLVDPHTIQIKQETGVLHVTAEAIILATGSRPWHIPHVNYQHPCVFDSDTILTLKTNPRIVTIFGAGVIGCEYTSIFRALGKKVNLINNRPHLLSFLDCEISEALSYHFRDSGVLIRNEEEFSHLETETDGVTLNLQSGKRLHSDIILFASGRTGNSEHLGLETVGLQADARGQVKVNAHFQTEIPHIYAVGDLVGFPALASSAYDQGRFAIRHFLDPDCDQRLVRDIPVGIYTIPEISCIGKTEAQLTQEKTPYEVGHTAFRQLARAQITGETLGMLKLLFHPDTLEILGIHCFGQSASEIIHIGQAILTQKNGGNSIRYFADTTFNYPTMAEAYRVAALNGLNRIRHMEKAEGNSHRQEGVSRVVSEDLTPRQV